MIPEPDWRARLARTLMHEVWRPLRWPRIALYALVLLVWASSAIWAAMLGQAQAGAQLSLPGRLLDLV